MTNKQSPKRSTGQFDRNLVVIYEGNHVTIPRHDGKCCQHMVRCVVEWSENSQKWVLKRGDEIIAPLSLARGYLVE